jgi:hypothetical protein
MAVPLAKSLFLGLFSQIWEKREIVGDGQPKGSVNQNDRVGQS